MGLDELANLILGAKVSRHFIVSPKIPKPGILNTSTQACQDLHSSMVWDVMATSVPKWTELKYDDEAVAAFFSNASNLKDARGYLVPHALNPTNPEPETLNPKTLNPANPKP